MCIVACTALVLWSEPYKITTLSQDKQQIQPNSLTVSPLTVEDIFESSAAAKAYPDDEVWTLVVTGDIIPARSVNTRTLTYNNFTWAFDPTADILRSGDITYVNLESPLTSDCAPTNSGMIFCGDVRHIQGLTFAGVDVVNLANNHLGNQGKQGIEETVSLLQKNNMVPIGTENNPQYTSVKGNRIAFLGYDDIEKQAGVSFVNEAVIKDEIVEARKNADVVIVQFHWGVEYVSQPTSRQRQLGKLAIDSGADLVIGNHPHWIQPVELYKGKLITYAHGNFIFDQMWSEKTKEGVIGTYTFYNHELVDVAYTPVYIEDYGQATVIANEQHKQRILQDMYAESRRLKAQ